MKTKFKAGMFGAIFLIASGVSNAASVSLTPSAVTAVVGQTFDLVVRGDAFANGVDGYSFSLNWDSNFLQLNTTGLQVNNQLSAMGWDIYAFASGAGAFSLDASSNVVFGGPLGVGGTAFDMVTLSFTVKDVPLVNPTDVALNFGPGGNWFDASYSTILTSDITFNSAAITVVPVPAAVWLLGSGLLGLVGVARRRRAAVAA